MDERVQHARNTLVVESQVAQQKASGLGHRLHSWRFCLDEGLTMRSACRACGRPIKIKVVPAGEFMDETVRATTWLAMGVGCKP